MLPGKFQRRPLHYASGLGRLPDPFPYAGGQKHASRYCHSQARSFTPQAGPPAVMLLEAALFSEGVGCMKHSEQKNKAMKTHPPSPGLVLGLFSSGWASRQPRPAPKGKPFGMSNR